MFGLFSRTYRAGTKKVARRPWLSVEQLEARDCPAGSIDLSATVLAGHEVLLSGDVHGAGAGLSVSFSGAVSATTTTDALGHFRLVTSAATLGAVTAADPAGNSISRNIAVTAPTITLGVSEVEANAVTLSGTVTDIDAAGETIAISGAKSGTVTADANGKFSFTMAPADLGTVDVSTTDLWGQTSNTAEVAASSFPPVIYPFTATQSDANAWIFRGTVTAPNLQGLTITFGGIPSLAGRTAIVAADGTFSLVVTLGNGEYGTATAQTTDQLGQNSNRAAAPVVGVTATSPGNQSNNDSDAISLPVAASDSAGDTLSYSATGLPPGLSINSNGVIVGTIASDADSSVPYLVTVIATDTAADVSATTTFNWTVGLA